MGKNKSNPTISTAVLMAQVAEKFNDVPKKMTKEIVHYFLNSVENSVVSGAKVRLDKLGILTVKDRAARKGRNPQTGEEVAIPASKKVAFRTASSLKEAVGVKKKSSSITKSTVTKKKK